MYVSGPRKLVHELSQLCKSLVFWCDPLSLHLSKQMPMHSPSTTATKEGERLRLIASWASRPPPQPGVLMSTPHKQSDDQDSRTVFAKSLDELDEPTYLCLAPSPVV